MRFLSHICFSSNPPRPAPNQQHPPHWPPSSSCLCPFFASPCHWRLSFVKLLAYWQAISLSWCCGLPLALCSPFIFTLWGFGQTKKKKKAYIFFLQWEGEKKQQQRNDSTCNSKTTKPFLKEFCLSHAKPIFYTRLNKLEQQRKERERERERETEREMERGERERGNREREKEWHSA